LNSIGCHVGEEINDGVSTKITRFIYDNEDILLELDGSNNIVARYTHGPGIDEPLTMEKGSESFFYHADGLGTVTEITDSIGALKQQYTYSSFGKIESQLDPNFIQPYTFAAREFDPETGLYFYRVRYYDASVGRFLSEDPLGSDNPDTDANFYPYAQNNPVNLTDPFGLFTYKPGVPPASPALSRILSCIESCYRSLIVITSTSEAIPEHPPGSPHRRGVAADIRYPSNPERLLCCAAKCGVGYARDEKIRPSPRATAPHIHVQIPSGKGGSRGDLPKDTSKCCEEDIDA